MFTRVITDPRSQSIIRECWGLMHAHDKQWQRAYAEFYSAFQAYQEVGQREKAKQCLQYVIVTNLLAGGTQNPFDAREAKVYQNDADIQCIVLLRQAYEKADVNGFATALNEIKQSGDQFIIDNLDRMIIDFQSRAVLSMIQSYRSIALQSLAQQLNATVKQIEKIILQLILDGQINGEIDQLNNTLHIIQIDQPTINRYHSQLQWCKQVSKLSHDAAHSHLQLTY